MEMGRSVPITTASKPTLLLPPHLIHDGDGPIWAFDWWAEANPLRLHQNPRCCSLPPHLVLLILNHRVPSSRFSSSSSSSPRSPRHGDEEPYAHLQEVPGRPPQRTGPFPFLPLRPVDLLLRGRTGNRTRERLASPPRSVLRSSQHGRSRWFEVRSPSPFFIRFIFNNFGDIQNALNQLNFLLAHCSTGATIVGLPPAWVDVSEEIAANMQRARTKMSELVKAHAKALMPSFGDGKEDQHVIEFLTHEITDLLKISEKRLRKLSSGDPTEDSNVRKNVQGQDGVDLEMNRNGIRHEMEDDFRDVGFDEVQLSTLKRSEAFTREREREIVQVIITWSILFVSGLDAHVVESVNELAQIMKDLSVLVIDQ
ncbi:hypothetical protein GW17_00019488, partial [Ensete ventricosum]